MTTVKWCFVCAVVLLSGFSLAHDYTTTKVTSSCQGYCGNVYITLKVAVTTANYEGYFSVSCLCHKHKLASVNVDYSTGCGCTYAKTSPYSIAEVSNPGGKDCRYAKAVIDKNEKLLKSMPFKPDSVQTNGIVYKKFSRGLEFGSGSTSNAVASLTVTALSSDKRLQPSVTSRLEFFGSGKTERHSHLALIL